MTNDQHRANDLAQHLSWLLTVNDVGDTPQQFFEQWSRDQWHSVIEVRNAVARPPLSGSHTGDYLNPTAVVPEWLRSELNRTWFIHPGSDPVPRWATSIDHRIDWFALADKHPELTVGNPYTQLITPTMMREATVLAWSKAAEVITHAYLEPGREPGTIHCAINALYVCSEHAPTVIVDIADIFGGLPPEPVCGTQAPLDASAATNPDGVYFGWTWCNMPLPVDF
ncbi:hypothetical protein [Microbacterium sp. A93]|uniref:hypothetical protein n=1 Tax=Microbacterium sp. A93 TaxID=3450716 RepID=UPI003F43A62A